MRKTFRVLAVVLAASFVAATAHAGTTASPVTYTVTTGDPGTGDVSDIQVDDGVYATIGSVRVNGKRRTVFIATFEGLPASDAIVQLRIVGRTAGPACNVKLAAFNWKAGKFVTWGGSTTVIDEPNDTDFSQTEPEIAPYVRRGKVKARFSCANEDEPFLLQVDQVSFST